MMKVLCIKMMIAAKNYKTYLEKSPDADDADEIKQKIEILES